MKNFIFMIYFFIFIIIGCSNSINHEKKIKTENKSENQTEKKSNKSEIISKKIDILPDTEETKLTDLKLIKYLIPECPEWFNSMGIYNYKFKLTIDIDGKPVKIILLKGSGDLAFDNYIIKFIKSNFLFNPDVESRKCILKIDYEVN